MLLINATLIFRHVRRVGFRNPSPICTVGLTIEKGQALPQWTGMVKRPDSVDCDIFFVEHYYTTDSVKCLVLACQVLGACHNSSMNYLTITCYELE